MTKKKLYVQALQKCFTIFEEIKDSKSRAGVNCIAGREFDMMDSSIDKFLYFVGRKAELA